MTDSPEISLVVCTRNRASQLSRALHAIAAIRSDHSWELVLVDNGSTDSTPEVLRRYAEIMGRQPVQVLTAREPGLSRARNVGWRAARGKIIAFTDDDCYPKENYIDAMLPCFRNPQVGYAGGRVLLHDPKDHPISILLNEEPKYFEPGSLISAGTIHGCNMAFRRSVLEVIGGFDESLGAGTVLQSGEDTDAMACASAHGFGGLYDPNPVVAHHHGRRQAQEIEKLEYGYDLGRGAYFLKGLIRPGCRLKFLLAWLKSARYRLWYRRKVSSVLNEIRGAWLYLTTRD